MKALIQIPLLILFCSLCLTAQERQETFSYNVELNTLTILDKDLFANCGALYSSLHEFKDNKLTILQLDTSTQWMKCVCYFDLSYTLRSLSPGNYDVEIYRERLSYPGNPIDTILVYSFSFEAKLGPMPPVGFDFWQSPCTGITDVEYKQYGGEGFIIAPNPTSERIMLKSGNLTTGTFDFETIGIYDVFGKSVKNDVKFNTTAKPAPDRQIEFDISKLPAGVYFLKTDFVNNGKVIRFVKY